MNKKGLTLIEILVAMGIASVVSAALAYLYSEFSVNQVLTDRRIMTGMIISEVNMVLSDSAACQLTFSGLNPTASVAVSDIKNSSASAIYSTGGKYFGISIVNMRLFGFAENSAQSVVNQRQGAASLELELDQNSPKYPNTEKHTIALSLTLNSANQVTGCRNLTQSFLYSFCLSLGGTLTPAGRCRDIDISGNINVSSNISTSSISGYFFGADVETLAGGNMTISKDTVVNANLTASSSASTVADVLGGSNATISNAVVSPVTAPTFEATTDFCVNSGGTCRTLINHLCAGGVNYYVSGINSSGSVNCILRPW